MISSARATRTSSPRSRRTSSKRRIARRSRARVVLDIPEEPIATKNGQRWLHTRKVPLLDEAGRPRYLLGISEDITERKRNAEALKEAKEKAEAVSREPRSFSYSVAHDRRAPSFAASTASPARPVEDCTEDPRPTRAEEALRSVVARRQGADGRAHRRHAGPGSSLDGARRCMTQEIDHQRFAAESAPGRSDAIELPSATLRVQIAPLTRTVARGHACPVYRPR